jgi:cysteinyl-tRNA synthetase
MDLNVLVTQALLPMAMCMFTFNRFSSRSYISFDILRRVLSDYFGYDVLYVMNITDIDDKIIKRARQDHLYDKYVAEEGHNLQKNLDDAKSVLEYVSETLKKTTDSDKKGMFERLLDKMTGAIEELEVAVKSKDEAKTKKAHEVLSGLELLSEEN